MYETEGSGLVSFLTYTAMIQRPVVLPFLRKMATPTLMYTDRQERSMLCEMKVQTRDSIYLTQSPLRPILSKKLLPAPHYRSPSPDDLRTSAANHDSSLLARLCHANPAWHDSSKDLSQGRVIQSFPCMLTFSSNDSRAAWPRRAEGGPRLRL